MAFLTQGKTNWKYILIVLILAVIVGGGILGYCQWIKVPKTKSLPVNEQKLAEKTVNGYVDALMTRTRDNVLPYLTGEAKAKVQKWPPIFGTSNPYLGSFEILNSKKLNANEFEFTVREYQEYTGEGIIGYNDETLTVIKVDDKYLISSIETGEYVDISQTANWKLYRNEDYGFEMKYPKSEKIYYEGKTEFMLQPFKIDFSSFLMRVWLNSERLEIKDYFLKESACVQNKPICEYLVQGYSLKSIKVGEVEGFTTEVGKRTQFFVATRDNDYIIEFLNRSLGEETLNQMLSTFRFFEEVKFTAELLLVQLYPIQPEIIKIRFNKDIDASTLNATTVKLFAVSISTGTAGQKQDLSNELNYSYDKNNRVLSITSKGMIIGGCAACRYELQLTDQIKDLKGNSLQPMVLPL